MDNEPCGIINNGNNICFVLSAIYSKIGSYRNIRLPAFIGKFKLKTPSIYRLKLYLRNISFRNKPLNRRQRNIGITDIPFGDKLLIYGLSGPSREIGLRTYDKLLCLIGKLPGLTLVRAPFWVKATNAILPVIPQPFL